jgi:class 3 adenylate cyclase/tetratricopeptide (TPR) repeat protein
MNCSRCQHENPARSKFCLECGARLALRCPSCSVELPAEAKFCNECGHALAASAPRFTSPESYTPRHLAEKILTVRSALEGERKQVTVLFVDVAGFTALSSRLDPEEVHGLMSRAFELMLEAVHRYEGTVNQFLGDGIMALFGAPIAHEDHARRAVHAALDLRGALETYQQTLERQRGITFRVRQGLNTGLVVVGSIGTDLRMDYTAVGDTTNVAARLQQAAAPGAIVISEAVRRLVEGFFETRVIDPVAAKGKSEPLPASEVVAARSARTRLEVRSEHGLTRFVGRERELRLLAECFDKVRSGQGQVVFLAGEAGIGKSRLLQEFRLRLADRATWLEGHAISFGRSIAFRPLIDLLKRNFGIEEGESEAAIIPKIEAGVRRLAADLPAIIPRIRFLLSVDPGDASLLTMDPRLRRSEIFEALRRLMLRAAEVRPQVLVFEDLHWMDQATEDFLKFIDDSLAAARVLVLLTYRPGHEHGLGDRTFHTRVAVGALASEESHAMAEAILASAGMAPEIDRLVLGKAEGNPFFVEEVLRSLLEVGAITEANGHSVLVERLGDVSVPDTIHDVIMARIDRLSEVPRKTLQLAAVIGREFPRRLLDRILDEGGSTEAALAELKALELIYEKSIFPEPVYVFKHALTHDVAYASLLIQRRQELHRLIGAAIEALYADRLAEQYEIVAYHFSRGGEWARALDYLVRAARKAAAAFANREAVALYDEALRAALQLGDAVDPRLVMDIHLALANLYFVLSEFERSRAAAGQALALARAAGDRPREGAALAATAWAATWARDLDTAVRFGREAIAVAEPIDAKPVLARAHFAIGFIRAVTGGLPEAREELDRARAISLAADDVAHLSLSLSGAGLLKSWAGDFAAGATLQAEGLGLARERNLLVPLLFSFFLYGLTLAGRGDYDGALGLFREGLVLSEKVGDEAIHHRLLNCLGWVHLELGDLDGALDLNRRGAEVGRRRKDPGTIPNAEINLADVFLARGDLPQAREFLEGIARYHDDPTTSSWMKWRYLIRLQASLGELWLAQGDLAKAKGCADRCLELATRSVSRKNLVKGWRLAGEIATARRQWEAAEQALGEALAVARSIGNPTQLWKSHLAMGRLRAESGRPDLARAEYRAAREVLDGIKSALQDPDLRAALERAPMLQQVPDLG